MSKCNEKIPIWRVLLILLLCVLTHYLYLYSHVFGSIRTAGVYRVVEHDVQAVLGDKYGSISYYLKIMKENPRQNEQAIADRKQSRKSGLISKPPSMVSDLSIKKSNVPKELIMNQLKNKILQNDSEPLLTLFTSWNEDVNKSLVHNLTIRNWISLNPFVIPVVFTNDTAVKEQCLQHGWEVLPIRIDAAGGVPVLKYMFLDVMTTYNTTFYAYSNSDILYTNTLIETLTSILNSSVDLEKPTLMVGKRTNVKFLLESEGSSWNNLTAVAKSRGNLFAGNAQDYFITTRAYPWSDIPEVVIGRRAYDNWLVYQARKHKQAVIDLTKTVLAVHQTTSAGNLEGHTHANKDYNYRLLKKWDRKIKYLAGVIDCAEQYTKYEQESIVTVRRTVNKRHCST